MNPRRPVLNTTLPEQTVEQMQWLRKRTGMTKSQQIVVAIRNLYNAEQKKISEGSASK